MVPEHCAHINCGINKFFHFPEWQDQRVAGWDFTSGFLTGTHGSYRIEPERDGSRVIIQANFHVAGAFGVLMPLMRQIVPRRLAGDLRNLKAIMEA